MALNNAVHCTGATGDPTSGPATAWRHLHEYVFLADIISHFIESCSRATKYSVVGARVTRNSELYVDEEDADNILKAVENELRNRCRGRCTPRGGPRHAEELVHELLEKLSSRTICTVFTVW